MIWIILGILIWILFGVASMAFLLQGTSYFNIVDILLFIIIGPILVILYLAIELFYYIQTLCKNIIKYLKRNKTK